MAAKGRVALLDRAELLRRIERGAAISEIADAFGLGFATVEQAIRRAGLWATYCQARMAHGHPDPAEPAEAPLDMPDGRVRARPRRRPRLDPEDVPPPRRPGGRRRAVGGPPAGPGPTEPDAVLDPGLGPPVPAEPTWYQPGMAYDQRRSPGGIFVSLWPSGFGVSAAAARALGLEPKAGGWIRLGILGRRIIIRLSHVGDPVAVRLGAKNLGLQLPRVRRWLQEAGMQVGRYAATAHAAGDVRWLEIDLEGGPLDARAGH